MTHCIDMIYQLTRSIHLTQGELKKFLKYYKRPMTYVKQKSCMTLYRHMRLPVKLIESKHMICNLTSQISLSKNFVQVFVRLKNKKLLKMNPLILLVS